MSPRTKPYKYERIASEIIHLIETGTFSPGDQLPSLREISQQKDVSISTAMQAYYTLEARGWAEARQRSGFYVRDQLPSNLPEPDVSAPLPAPTQVSMRELVIRVVLADTHHPELVQLGAAHPNPELSATSQLNRVLTSIARKMGVRSGMYDYVPGSKALRAQIARRALASGCSLTPDDIIITCGCSEAVNLCLRAVCKPGDTVAVESPMAFDALLCLETLGLQALEIPTHPRNGISLYALRFALEHNRVSACIVNSNFSNPLGSCIPDKNKQTLAALVSEYKIPLIENDIFGEIYFGEQRPPTVSAYDQEGLVMLCSSFSKTLAPGYRVGWVVPGKFKETVEWLKYTTSLAAPTLSEYAIAEFMESGSFAPYLRRIRREYARRVSAMSQAVQRYFPEASKITRPTGGFLLWVQLPASVDALQLYNRALRAGIAITPGHVFSAADHYREFIRLNAANWNEIAQQAIKTLGGFVHDLSEGVGQPQDL
jgi:DNA-binding transcriptional MocR family regulator